MDFERTGYATAWLDRSQVPREALALLDTDRHLQLVRASEWWSDGNSAEYAESNCIPRAELERVARMEFSDEPLFPEASW